MTPNIFGLTLRKRTTKYPYRHAGIPVTRLAWILCLLQTNGLNILSSMLVLLASRKFRPAASVCALWIGTFGCGGALALFRLAYSFCFIYSTNRPNNQDFVHHRLTFSHQL